MDLLYLVFLALLGSELSMASPMMSDTKELECAPAKIPEKVHITTIETWPYYRQSRERGSDVCVRSEGFMADIVARLANMVGFEYEFHVAKDGRYGQRGPDGTWNGMVGEILRKEMDLAAAPLTVTSQRLGVVDFTLPVIRTGVVMVYKRPENNAPLPFNDVKSLLEADIPVGALDKSSTASFLQASTDTQLHRLWLAIKRHNRLATNTQQGLDLVRGGNYVFIMEKDSAQLATRSRPCDLVIVGSHLTDRDYAFATPVGSPLTAPLSRAIASLQESGEISQLIEKYWPNQCADLQ